MNYLIGVWKKSHFHFQDIPIPNGDHRWVLTANILQQPKWGDRNVLHPLRQQLADTLAHKVEKKSKDDNNNNGEHEDDYVGDIDVCQVMIEIVTTQLYYNKKLLLKIKLVIDYPVSGNPH